MLIHNSSFFIPRMREDEFLKWFDASSEAIVMAGNNPRLSAMREAQDEDQQDSPAQSIAFQLEFDNIDDVRRYSAGPLADFLKAFNREFGPDAMVFTSLFEKLDLV